MGSPGSRFKILYNALGSSEKRRAKYGISASNVTARFVIIT
jgi:hypothetical protein